VRGRSLTGRARCSCPLSRGEATGEWRFTSADLKNYPHFDRPLRIEEVEGLVKNPERVRTHPFFPFIRFKQEWQPFRRAGAARRKKVRYIRYAARGDAYIFSYYRHLLSERYEALLQELELSDCVIAYRKIPAGGGERAGKCNIHFAAEAFTAVAEMGNCCVVALDISSYFESIDHGQLREVWCRLLEVDELPADHATVYKHITRYADVERELVYERLGHCKRRENGSWEHLTAREAMPVQLCAPADFRAKIAGVGSGLPSLLVRNKYRYGIPQGAPISDVLANAYLLGFDTEMAAYTRARAGVYRRYSDDILIVLPGDGRAGKGAREYAARLIKKFGDQLVIKPEKSCTVKFRKTGARQTCQWIHGGRRTNGLEYLGFRFDGTSIYLRDSTLSNLNRKITRSLRAIAHGIVARYPGKDKVFLISRFNLDKFMQHFGRVEDFEENRDYRKWTFWTYARRAGEVMGPLARPIFGQLSRHRDYVKHWTERELKLAIRARAGRRKQA
jgi:hypothetical protein